jgi:hypothetical protein
MRLQPKAYDTFTPAPRRESERLIPEKTELPKRLAEDAGWGSDNLYQWLCVEQTKLSLYPPLPRHSPDFKRSQKTVAVSDTRR